MRWFLRRRRAAEAPASVVPTSAARSATSRLVRGQAPRLTLVPEMGAARAPGPRVREPRLVIHPVTVWIVADDGSAVAVYEAGP
jgi:hypothetical protein